MKRVRKQIRTLAEAQAENIVLLEGESYFVNNNGTIEHWIGLDGVRERNGNTIVITGTPFNSLPSSCKINAAQSAPPSVEDAVSCWFWDSTESDYVQGDGVSRIFTGPFDPSNYLAMTDRDFWFQSIELNPPSSLTASIVSVNTIRTVWVDNSSDEDGFRVDKSQSYLDWDLDIADGATIALGDRIMVSGVLYTCTTGHTLATPRVFNSQNFSITALSFTTVTTTAPNVTTYDITGNEYGKRYTVRVSAVKGDVVSYNNPVATAKTDALSGGGDSQTDQILALTGLWVFNKMYDSAAPLADASGNNRTMTLVGSATFQQPAIETTDTGDYSILVNQGGNGFKRDGSIWTFKTESWEMGGIFMVPNPWGVPGNAPFMGLYKQGSANGKIRIWTDSTSTKFQIQTVTDGGSWAGSTSTFTFAKDVPYMVTMAYDHTVQKLYCWVNNQMVVEHAINLNTAGFTCDSFGWGHDGGSNLNLRMQKCFVKAGAMLTSQERADIYNAGTYI